MNTYLTTAKADGIAPPGKPRAWPFARMLALLAGLALSSLGSVARAAGSDDPVVYSGQFPSSTTALTPAALTVAGVGRDALVYRPASAGAAPPLLIFYSGTGATLNYNTADEIGREWLQSFANSEGVLLVFPMPLVQTHGDWDNHSAGTPYWQTADAEGNSAPVSANPDTNPDLLLSRALIKESILRWGADAERVYVSGFSNGAMFSYFVAVTLAERVAAFAETGGGLILSHTTAGEPQPCVPPANSGSAGALRSCSETGWTPGMCQSSGATPRPQALPPSGRIPPGFLRAHDDDLTVPYAHTCNLAAALQGRTNVSASIAHQVGGHFPSLDFLESSWAFLKAQRLPAQGTPISFTPVRHAGRSTRYVSNTVTVSGLSSAQTVSVSGGDVSINGGAFGSGGSIGNGQTLTVGQTSSPYPGRRTRATVTVGDIAAPSITAHFDVFTHGGTAGGGLPLLLLD